MKLTRKKFIASALAATGFSLHTNTVMALKCKVEESALVKPHPAGERGKMKICIFSKHLQWMNYKDMPSAVADLGFDGIDLTVRRNGHVVPERVENELPEAVAAAGQAGVKIFLASTDIEDVNPLTQKILETMSSVKISNYRSAGLSYHKDIDIPTNLERIRLKFKRLEIINKENGLHSDYLNHSGDGFGSSLWDLWLTLKDLDPKFVGSQFDIKHATIAGSYSWPVDFNLINRYIHTTVVRDFHWEKLSGKWTIKPVPLGEGMVDFKRFISMIKHYNISGPMIIMYDYPIGGAESGDRKLTMPAVDVLKAMKKDLDKLKSWLKEADL